MHFSLIPIVVLVVAETAMGEEGRTNSVFPGRQLSVNGSSSLATSKPAMSVIHCSLWCLEDDDCVAANYEDAGVCHMSSAGHISLEDNSHVTAILAPLEDSLNMVGWWPLQEAYGGKDLSDLGNDIELYDVTFNDSHVTSWASPAVDFKGTAKSYGHIRQGHHLDVRSFSWMAKVYVHSIAQYSFLFTWQFSGHAGVTIYLYSEYLGTNIEMPECSHHYTYQPTSLPTNVWHTVAVTYDFPTNTLTLWLNGESRVSTKPACGTNIETSPELYIGKRSEYDGGYPFHGRLSCMSLYSSVVDYDVMYAATMRQCGGD